MRFTPIGVSALLRSERVFRISARKAAASGCVSAVTIPIPPALETAATKGASARTNARDRTKHARTRTRTQLVLCSMIHARTTDVVHASLDDWVLDAEALCEFRDEDHRSRRSTGWCARSRSLCLAGEDSTMFGSPQTMRGWRFDRSRFGASESRRYIPTPCAPRRWARDA